MTLEPVLYLLELMAASLSVAMSLPMRLLLVFSSARAVARSVWRRSRIHPVCPRPVLLQGDCL